MPDAPQPDLKGLHAGTAGVRLAASSSGAELHPGWAWGLTAMVILAGGVTLHTARAAIGAAFDRWLPRLERPAETMPFEEPALPATAPDLAPVVEPEWTYVDVEAALRPLPERAEALIAEGRAEMSQFADLDSADETRALVIRNRWRLWGRVWHNRVDHVRGPMPPPEACDIHAALEPTCRAVRKSLALLDRVPAAGNAGEAKELLESASAILEQLRQAQAEDVSQTEAEGFDPGTGARSALVPGEEGLGQ